MGKFVLRASPRFLVYLSDTIKDIVYIVVSVEGVVIKIFLIGVHKLPPFPAFLVRSMKTLFIFRCGCHTHPDWLPPYL